MIKTIILKKTVGGSSRPRHPWIYKSQIKTHDPSIKAGEIVDVVTDRNRFIGRGYYNPRSQITVRILSTESEPIDASFFSRKFTEARSYRSRCVSQTNAWRLVSSEADGLPGLIVDQYGEVLVVQILTAGMEAQRVAILEALDAVIVSRGVYERSDSSSRRIEGLEEKKGWIKKECGEEVEIYEGDIRYRMSFGEGQKTGFYLDQRDNRLLLASFGFQGRVLDAFCYVGGFSLPLGLKGCEVTGIDIQEDAIRQAKENRRLNGLDESKVTFEVGNAFNKLREYEKSARKFNVVILDPPSFVKKKEALSGALSGYKEICLRSLKLLEKDGHLAVFSCSYHLDENLLMQVMMSAALDAKRDVRVVKFLKQSLDHPINPFIPETYYLKGFLFWVA